MDSIKKTSALPKGFTSPHELSGMSPDTPMLVAYSGGADSGALLHMILKYAKDTAAPVYAAHVNHGIRGAEADRDEEFCRKTAKDYGIELFVLRANVPEIARQTQKSIETAARDVRYEYFSQIMTEKNIPVLCVAHNADDNLETIIFNIARGSGLSGVCGIPQTRDVPGGVLVRPMLGIGKSDILAYCKENDIEYVTDSTNKDTEYTRNRIRERVIPELKALCEGAEYSAARLSESLRADALCLQSMAGWFLSETRKGFAVETEKLNGSPYSISSRAIMSLYSEISGGRSLEYVHVKAILALSERSVPHSSLTLPSNIYAVIEDGHLVFTKKAPLKAQSVSEDFRIDISNINDKKISISQINAEIIIGNTQDGKNIYKKSMKLLIDSDKILGAVYIRPRIAGDKIRLKGMSKSIKKLMCDLKIPIEMRHRIPVICDDAGVIAVPFIGVRDSCAPNRSCENILSIEFGIL